MAGNLPVGVALSQLPLPVPHWQMGVPLNEETQANLSAGQLEAAETLFALAEPLLERKKVVTAEIWQAVKLAYDRVIILGLGGFCPVIQLSIALALGERPATASADGAAGFCSACGLGGDQWET